MICMMTDVYGAGSYVLAAGSKSETVYQLYSDYDEDKLVSKLVSRKKQMLPNIIEALS